MSSPFAFITEEWLDLQTWATQIRGLPRTEQGFAERYGGFEDAADTKSTEQALIQSNAIADALGSATAVKQQIAKNGSYLTTSTPPDMIYARVIWWALLVENVANTLDYQTKAVGQLLTGPDASADDVRSVLNAGSGLSHDARNAATQGTTLADAIIALKEKLFPQIETFAGTSMVNEANRQIGYLGSEIEGLCAQAAKDYKDWKHKTLAPGESPPPLDVAAEQESGFSFPWNKSAEKRAKKDYIAVLAQIEESKTEVAQKAQFVADVKGLDIAGNNVIPALNNLASGIRKIADTLDQAGERLESVCENANDAQLTDASWMKNALNLGAVTELGPEAAAFVQQALVETHLQPPAGT